MARSLPASARPLHVTNGDAAGAWLRTAGIVGPVLPWRDVLHEGPVPSVPDAELRRRRAAFLAACGWVGEADARDELEARDAALDAALAAGTPVVLWFEHDLYDQLQLLQTLERAHRLGGDVRLVQADDYLTSLAPAAAPALLETALALDAPTLEGASQAWAAFTGPDPAALEGAARAGVPALRHLRPALERLLEEFPAVGDGLSRSERQALSVFADGGERGVPLRAAYLAAHHDREAAVFMGDTAFGLVVGRLAARPAPLARGTDGEPLPPASPVGEATWARRIALTPHGRDVLGGRADLLGLGGVDRWIGGVHLRSGRPAWRWDPEGRRLVAPPAGETV